MTANLSTSNTIIINEMNLLLESIFIQGEALLNLLTPEMIARFLLANKLARDSGDRSLEQTQLLIGKACDERCKDRPNDEAHHYFIKLIEYVRLYDDIQEQISKLAFIETISVDAEMITSLHQHRLVFDALEKSLFERLFLADLLASKFIGSYGRRKIKILADGLNALEAGRATAIEITVKLIML